MQIDQPKPSVEQRCEARGWDGWELDYDRSLYLSCRGLGIALGRIEPDAPDRPAF